MQSSVVQKYLVENSRKKQLISFQLSAILSSVMKSCAIPPSPTQDVNHPIVQRLHTLYALHPLVI